MSTSCIILQGLVRVYLWQGNQVTCQKHVSMLVHQVHHLLQHDVPEQVVLAAQDDLSDPPVNQTHVANAGEGQEGHDVLHHLPGQHVQHRHLQCDDGTAADPNNTIFTALLGKAS